jgi:hypothetical protein
VGRKWSWKVSVSAFPCSPRTTGPLHALLSRPHRCPAGPGGVSTSAVTSKLEPTRSPRIRADPPAVLPPQGDSGVVSSLGPPSRIRKRFPQTQPRIQHIGLATPETSLHLGVLVPSISSWGLGPQKKGSNCPPPEAAWLHPGPDLPKQRYFSPCSSGSPHFRQTCACFLFAWAHLGLPPPAPPSPGDKPHIVS